MNETEKVINGLWHEFKGCMYADGKDCHDCSYNGTSGCLDEVLHDAILLLKESEAKAPIKLPAMPTMPKEAWRWGCPKCGLDVGYKWNFCPSCGQKMDWKTYT